MMIDEVQCVSSITVLFGISRLSRLSLDSSQEEEEEGEPPAQSQVQGGGGGC